MQDPRLFCWPEARCAPYWAPHNLDWICTLFMLFAHDCWLMHTVSGNHQWICFLDDLAGPTGLDQSIEECKCLSTVSLAGAWDGDLRAVGALGALRWPHLPLMSCNSVPIQCIGENKCDSIIACAVFHFNSCMFTKHRSGGPSLLQSIGYSGEDKISRGDCPHLQLLLPAGKIQGVLPERQSTISSRSKLVLCSYLIHC